MSQEGHWLKQETGPPYLANVGIRVVGIDSPVLLHVLKGVGHVASTTAAVAGDAVDQVLGAEVQHLARLLLQLPLQSARRAERPARSTLALPREKHGCQTGGHKACKFFTQVCER